MPDTHPGVANAMAVGICLANEGCSFPRSTTRSLIRQGNILTWKCPAVLKTPCAFRALITCVVSVCSVCHAYDYIYMCFLRFSFANGHTDIYIYILYVCAIKNVNVYIYIYVCVRACVCLYACLSACLPACL